MGFFGRLTGLFARAGLCTVKLFAAVLLGILRAAGLIASELWSIVRGIGRVIAWLFRDFTESLRKRMKLSKEQQKEVRRAKKEGGREYAKALTMFIGSYLFGEGGVFYTAFNYILPIVSAAFLVGVVRYGSGLEYGISVTCNGREVGIISAEADFEEAEREVQQRIAYGENDEVVDLSASFSLKIISDSDRIMTSEQLANELLAASDEELTQAYGIYIDGRFVGAVRDKTPVEDALAEHLLNYDAGGTVRNVSYKNQIKYTDGVYLLGSVMTEQEAIDMMTSSTSSRGIYVAQSGDTVAGICQKYNMKLEEYSFLNPLAGSTVEAGQVVFVLETESFLPIQYIREMETLSFIDYETIEVETSALNVGVRSILVKGEQGERVSDIEVTYVDGIERSRTVVHSEVTKQPVVEQIGIGTYAAKPDDPATCYFGMPLTGSGEFSWPLNGGYVSDTFISNRNHKGMDLAAPAGTDIYAAADGQVVSAGWNSGGYGYFVMIDHLNGYQTVYAHMSAVYAVEGQTVSRGQLIGAVGNTGNSFGDHCHLEVRYMGVCLDPASFINTEDYGDDDEDQ
ncbi:MAG: peptidoglycan DD-metalloendopeptidase family protein [Ruminococcus sp.]|nr:peptidoglycan DD-metalloendopeptidase family protein [Ruminococcus sp.]